ncbi:MAG: Fic family protein, partial [Gemmatimonadaceae bacterium]
MPTTRSTRAGEYIRQPGGFDAFLPKHLPPDPPIETDRVVPLLSRADQAIGRLDGEIRNMPNPDLFVAMYVRREAVFSSQIEGTQSTLDDLLAVELRPRVAEIARDVDEIVNYVAAMNHGLRRLTELPLSLRLIREIHGELLRGVRGANKRPGEFRRDQNFIAPAGGTDIADATFVPPPVPDMHRS